MRIGIGVPVGLIAILAMMILPLPPVMLDVLFTFNIALSLVIVMAVFHVRRPLEFAIFPTVLLLVTLLRLALNVASTRVVLMHGHEGAHAAGKVIEAFGEFVIGGNYAVGVVVFIILTIINFVVVTKGAGRVSEVSARFTLDAMPGKQMAIDADLNAGLITQDEARARRLEVRAEADFYGSMDGASKFVRGDAVAGILIMVINIVGGLLHRHDDARPADRRRRQAPTRCSPSATASWRRFPACCSRSRSPSSSRASRASRTWAANCSKQLFGQPKALGVAAAVLGIMGLIPGMPNIAFLSIAALCGCGAWRLVQEARSRRPRRKWSQPEPPPPPPSPESQELSWEDVRPVDVDRPRSRLSPRAAGRSHQGRRLAGAHPRHPPQAHAGARLPRAGRAHPRQPGTGAQRLSHQAGRCRHRRKRGASGSRARHQSGPRVRPARMASRRAIRRSAWKRCGSSLPCASTRSRSATRWSMPRTVIATHLSHLIQTHAHELFGHEEAEQLLKTLAKTAPKLVEELVPKVLPLAVVVRVMQGLLAERVPIRNVRAIVEALAEAGPRTQDPPRCRRRSGLPWVDRSSRTSSDSPKSCPSSHLSRNSSACLSNGLANAAGESGSGARAGRALATWICQRPRSVKNVAVNRRCC